MEGCYIWIRKNKWDTGRAVECCTMHEEVSGGIGDLNSIFLVPMTDEMYFSLDITMFEKFMTKRLRALHNCSFAKLRSNGNFLVLRRA